MAKITIEDISRYTGLSRGTVSRALNDRPDISSQTKELVLEACRKLNYVPSPAARSLATGRSYAVAVLVDDLRSSFGSTFLRGVIERASPNRYAVHVAEIGSDAGQATTRLRSLGYERIDSVLIAGALSGPLVQTLTETIESRPVIAGASLEGLSCDVLTPDHREVGRLVARHLLEGGRRDVLYVFDSDSPATTDRLRGFHEVCEETGLNPEAVTAEVPRWRAGNGDRFGSLGSRLSGVSAIAADNDFLALQILLLANQTGRKIGTDLAIIGSGNETFTERVTPSLSTVDYCGEEVGRRAMDTALQRIGKTRMDAPATTRIAPRLLLRDSSRPSA